MKYLAGYIDPFISPVTGKLIEDVQLPNLQSGFIWIGNQNNFPEQQNKISIENLPSLEPGKIWRGDIDGVAVESDDLTLTINKVNELSALINNDNFIQGSENQISVAVNDDLRILTISDNPVFNGDESITIPYGHEVDRPNPPKIGMIRIKLDENEFY